MYFKLCLCVCTSVNNLPAELSVPAEQPAWALQSAPLLEED